MDEQRLAWPSALEVNAIHETRCAMTLTLIGGLFLFGGVVMFFDRSMYVHCILLDGKD